MGPNCHIWCITRCVAASNAGVVVTFHSRDKKKWSVREGSREEVRRFYFTDICPRAAGRASKSWKRWATADRDPIAQWTFGRDAPRRRRPPRPAAIPAGRLPCPMENAVTLGEALRANSSGFLGRRSVPALASHGPHASCCPPARWAASSTRGVERLVRNELWKGARTGVSADARMALRLDRRKLSRTFPEHTLTEPLPLFPVFGVSSMSYVIEPEAQVAIPFMSSDDLFPGAPSTARRAATPRMRARWASIRIASRRSSSASWQAPSSWCRRARRSTCCHPPQTTTNTTTRSNWSRRSAEQA